MAPAMSAFAGMDPEDQERLAELAERETAYGLFQRAGALLKRRHHAQAAVLLERASRLEPRKASIVEALGARVLQQRPARARGRELPRADRHRSRRRPTATFGLGQSLKMLGQRDEARTHLRPRGRAGAQQRLVPERARPTGGRPMNPRSAQVLTAASRGAARDPGRRHGLRAPVAAETSGQPARPTPVPTAAVLRLRHADTTVLATASPQRQRRRRILPSHRPCAQRYAQPIADGRRHADSQAPLARRVPSPTPIADALTQPVTHAHADPEPTPTPLTHADAHDRAHRAAAQLRSPRPGSTTEWHSGSVPRS